MSASSIFCRYSSTTEASSSPSSLRIESICLRSRNSRCCFSMAESVAAHLRRDGLSARTVTTKLRYADFSIRSRSTTLPTPIDEPERIGELACALLDRGLRDRPGALRLVGVGVSGLTAVRQLTFDEL